MSTPRAIRPLFGVGSRLIVDKFIPRSARTVIEPVQKKLFSSTSSSAFRQQLPLPLALPISICWDCRQSHSSKRQIRFSSSSSKPPDDGRRREYEPQNPPFSPPSSSSPSSRPTTTNTTDGADPTNNNHQQDSADSSTAERDQKRDRSPPQPPPSTLNPDLPSAQNSRRSALNQTLSSFMDRAQTTLFTASQRINDLTGYSSIESLKASISTIESQLQAAQEHLTATRMAYKSAVSNRATTQREVTTLLARQKTWTSADFDRFTLLYRQDYELEASVGEHASELERAEREAERLNRELGTGILARYHEEQIWSDKIRRMSTWGTWGLMSVNILLFLILQFGAEPWRRQRLVRGFEEKVREALAEERAAREAAQLAATPPPSILILDDESDTTVVGVEDEGEPKVVITPDAAVPQPDIPPTPVPVPDLDSPLIKDFPPLSWREALTDLDYWRSIYEDLTGDRRITLRIRDISLIAAQGLATGIVAATLTALLVRSV